jgi:hypothetical protein
VNGRLHIKSNQNKTEEISNFKNFLHVSGTWTYKFSSTLRLIGRLRFDICVQNLPYFRQISSRTPSLNILLPERLEVDSWTRGQFTSNITCFRAVQSAQPAVSYIGHSQGKNEENRHNPRAVIHPPAGIQYFIVPVRRSSCDVRGHPGRWNWIGYKASIFNQTEFTCNFCCPTDFRSSESVNRRTSCSPD